MMNDESNVAPFNAGQLNNVGANCIEERCYDQAISSLSKALRIVKKALTKKKKQQESSSSGSNNHCTIDGCIQFSEIHSPVVNSSPSAGSNDDSNNVQNFCRSYKRSSKENDAKIGVTTAGYIYQKPIRVVPRSVQEKNSMGWTLYLILTFNLALVYHLKAVQSNTNSNKDETDDEESTTRKYSHVALKLYNHAIIREVQLIRQKYYGSSSSTSESARRPTFENNTRFNMILYSNMSQIYEYLDNTEKYQFCQKQLVSIIMAVIENRTRKGGGMTTAIGTNSQENDTALPSQNDSVSNDFRIGGNLDGFLQNSKPWMEQNHCAHAA